MPENPIYGWKTLLVTTNGGMVISPFDSIYGQIHVQSWIKGETRWAGCQQGFLVKDCKLDRKINGCDFAGSYQILSLQECSAGIYGARYIKWALDMTASYFIGYTVNNKILLGGANYFDIFPYIPFLALVSPRGKTTIGQKGFVSHGAEVIATISPYNWKDQEVINRYKSFYPKLLAWGRKYIQLLDSVDGARDLYKDAADQFPEISLEDAYDLVRGTWKQFNKSPLRR